MKNSEKFTSSVTEIYAELVMHHVHTEFPEFQPGNGQIIYDDESEQYLYIGFTSEEIFKIKAVERKLHLSFLIKPAA